MATDNNNTQSALAELTADIVAAYVGNNSVPAEQLPQLITNVHGALSAASSGGMSKPEKLEPALSIRRSVTDEAISCLYCGKRFRSLRRHIRTHHNVTPEQYREQWGLKSDYPMTAPGYARTRSALAKKAGLGRKRKAN